MTCRTEETPPRSSWRKTLGDDSSSVDQFTKSSRLRQTADCWRLLVDIRFTFAYAAGMAITRRQRELYDFLSRFVAEKGYSPSFEEIKEGMGLSSLATVHKHVTNLEKKGLLTRDYNRSRSIDLLPPKGKLKQSMAVNTAMVLPLVGRIAAGQPIEAVQNNDDLPGGFRALKRSVRPRSARRVDAGRSDPRRRLRVGRKGKDGAQR